MKKIIFITESLVSMGGVVRVVSAWGNLFANKGYDVETISVYPGKPYFNLDNRIKFTIINFKFRYKLFKLIDVIPNTIKMYNLLKSRKNSNVIFNKSLYIEPIWILRKLGFFKDVNLIYFSHGGSSGFKNFYLSRKLVAHRLSMIFDVFDKVICLYDDEKNYPKQVNKNKLYFISNTLTFEKSLVTFEKKSNVVLSLGRVTKLKGIDTLIYSWNMIKNEVGDWVLRIVGEGEDKAKFEALVKKLKISNIEFVKGTDNVKPFYEDSQIFVIPSVLEGFGLTIIEAMACRCCVISSKTAGGLKLVTENGILFDIGNKRQLANAILLAINNREKREELANKSYEFVNQFDINRVKEKWNDVLK